MKKLILFPVLFAFPAILFSQEEFFGTNNGLSFSYQQGFNREASPIFGTGLSAYFKSGYAVGIAIQNIDDQSIPSARLAFYARAGSEHNPLITSFGLSYGYSLRHNFVAADFSLIKCFFPHPDFPFALHGYFSLQTGFENKTEIGTNLIIVAGFGYIQAFFATKKLYPFIGISGDYALESDYHLYTAFFGLNLKIGAKSETNQPQGD